MQHDSRLLYWDANVILSYFNGDDGRLATLDAILADISRNKNGKIVTSVLSKVEVTWVSNEKLSRVLDKKEEERIDSFWNDASVIEVVDLNDEIAYIARSLLRNAMQRRWTSLKPNDAIHLATAEWVGSSEFNTYDKDLFRYDKHIGIEIRTPFTMQPRLL